MDELRRIALRLPGTAEGVACAGTALESRAITAGGKAFLFLRDTETRLKLRDSLPELTALAAAEPDRYGVGAHGWVALRLPLDAGRHASAATWIEESFRLVASRKAVARLSTRD